VNHAEAEAVLKNADADDINVEIAHQCNTEFDNAKARGKLPQDEGV
jgi:hypothetical protein